MRAVDRRPEAGATLVEILVAVAVLGIGFVALLGGMGTTFASSALHREQARGEVEVRRYAEAVKAAPFSATCPASYTQAGIGHAGDPAFSYSAPTVVAYLDEATGAPTSCSTATPRLHVVRVTVTSATDGRADQTLDVAKRPT